MVKGTKVEASHHFYMKRKEMESLDQQKVYDPFLAWKEMYDKTESYWGKVLGENMNKEEFSQWMGNVLNLNLQYHHALNETTGRYFQQVNIPTKDDVANVASLVINVEEKVEALEDRLDEWHDAQAQDNSALYKRELNKIKTDVKSMEKKLDQVLEAIEQQQQFQSKLQNELQSTLQEQLQQKLQQQNQQLQASFQEQLKLQEQAAAKDTKEPIKAQTPVKETKGQQK
jgi:polyhydroxyalkanoic acid synthase PhaR subunit